MACAYHYTFLHESAFSMKLGEVFRVDLEVNLKVFGGIVNYIICGLKVRLESLPGETEGLI